MLSAAEIPTPRMRAGLRRAAAALAGGLLLAGAVAQTPATGVGTQGPGARGLAGAGPFALPWEIDFDDIRRAMAGSSYDLDQVRRVLDRTDPRLTPTSWIRIQERLRHVAETATTKEQFVLEMTGLENQQLSQRLLNLRAAQFSGLSEALFYYQSFRVADAQRAAQNYSITFLGISVRLQRPVYQVAVLSTAGARSAWLLELDIATGYPLYRAEYDLDGVLVGEVEVTRYDPTFQGQLPDTTAPRPQVVYTSPVAAAAALGVATKTVPQAGVLPPGYTALSSKVVTDPLSGEQRATLVYSDGIDQVFVLLGKHGGDTLGPGHTITVHRDPAGMTQCMFIHEQVQYIVIGRGAAEPVRQTARRLYSQAVVN